jgi:serine protease Do
VRSEKISAMCWVQCLVQEHCLSKLLANSLFTIRCRFRLGRNFALPFLVATPLLKTCQNFCQRKEVKAMRRYLLALSVLMASLVTAQEAVDWSSLVEKVMPAVVTIVSVDAKDIVQGSGFIISSDGKIVTNFHVVAGKPAILARRSDGSFLVIKSVLASDKANDLAILQAEGRNLPFVRLGDSDAVKVGEAICVIGSPMLLEGAVSAGVISAVRELQDGRKLLQITAPISEGSSGSPVFNRKGEVIGVASFILSEGQNLNFAVPSNVVKALLSRLGTAIKPIPPSSTQIEDAWDRSWTLRQIVAAMAEVGQFDRALQIAQKIEDAWHRSWALKDIAEAMAKAGQKERANQVFQLALQTAQKIEVARVRSFVLMEIARAMAKAGQMEGANQAFQLALQTAQR